MKPVEKTREITPSEMVRKSNEMFPHFKMRLSREGDPELSTVLIHFFPESMQSKASTPPEKSEQNLPPDEQQLKMHKQYLKSMKERFRQ